MKEKRVRKDNDKEKTYLKGAVEAAPCPFEPFFEVL